MIGDTELLELWEHSLGLHPAARALELAAAADPAHTAGELAAMPVGVREARLLEFRTGLAGPRIAATARCPGCDEQVEFEVDAETLARTAASGEPRQEAGRTLTVDGTRITWRCATGADLAAIAELEDPASAESELLRRCILAVEPDPAEHQGSAEVGRPRSTAQLGEAARSAVSAAMEEADPLAEVMVTLACPDCGAGFAAELDVAEFAWTELDAAAVRLLWEIDALATAYGWTEADVLALSPRRRRTYLEMVVDAGG